MSHAKVWVMLDDFTRIFKYGGTELGKIINNPWNTNEWTIQPSFNVSCVSQSEIGASKYRTLGQASQALICLLYTSPSPRDAHESRMPSSA